MKVHLVGIGGAGVSPLASLHLAMGDEVSGCDQAAGETTRRLAAAGARIQIGHHLTHADGADLIVYTGAAPSDLPELERGRARGIPVLSRAEALARLMAEMESVAVAGCHGKTTVTAMLGAVLDLAGWGPAVLVGDGAGSRAGRLDAEPRWLVAEADESDRTLVLHRARHCLVTNIDFDHPDHYRDLDDVTGVFARFLAGLRGGVAAICADDPRLTRLPVAGRRVTYGLAEQAEYRLVPETGAVLHAGRELGRLRLGVPGLHNLVNATGVAALASELGVDFEVAARALAGFRGAHRRFQRLGEYRGAWVYDDYGHHPVEIAATLEAARGMGPRRLFLVFQPHRYSRFTALEAQFADALAGADRVVVCEIYPAGEVNPGGVTAASLAARVPGAVFAPDLAAAERALDGVESGDLVLLMGAGDVWRLGHELTGRG